MNLSEGYGDIFEEAKGQFIAGQYKPAEALLNQLVLKNQKAPEIFHMLGTIYYDQGKFNKAIRTFRRALELDPSFTDASVGLSIILNDLGRYEEGRQVFHEAKLMLDRKSLGQDAYLNERLSVKHDELGELYFQHQRFNEALEQYHRALALSNRKPELTMKVVECHCRVENYLQAIKDLRELRRQYPKFSAAGIKLGKLFYDSHRVPEAVAEWEEVLQHDPSNSQVKDYLRLAQSVEMVTVPEVEI